MKDPYAALGVSKTATQEEIKNAYRKAAKKFHPDLNPGNKQAEQKFKEINAANELIGDPEQRSKFDRGQANEESARNARQQGPFYYETQSGAGGRYSQTYGQGFDEDIFESIFGGRRGQSHGQGFQARGEDEIYRMEIDLADTVHGSGREITLPNGKRLAVKIPKGVHSGTKLRFAGQGSPGLGGGPPGDAYIEIQVRPSEQFRQMGDDLMIDLPITLYQAVLGGEARVPTIDGPVSLRIPAGVNTDRKLKLSGKGLFNRETGKRGDQIVALKILLPARIDPELKEAIRKSARAQGYAEPPASSAPEETMQ